MHNSSAVATVITRSNFTLILLIVVFGVGGGIFVSTAAHVIVS